MDSLSEIERYIFFIGVTLLAILFLARLRIARKGKVVVEEDSLPIYETKDILLQDKPKSRASMGYIPTKSILNEKNTWKSYRYLILVMILIWIILKFPVFL